jgi:hypothetical protein
LPVLRNAFGVVIIGTKIRDLSSCRGSTSPKALGGRAEATTPRLKQHLEATIAGHEQIAAEVERASEPDAPTTSHENETALSSETPGQ